MCLPCPGGTGLRGEGNSATISSLLPVDKLYIIIVLALQTSSTLRIIDSHKDKWINLYIYIIVKKLSTY